MKVDADVGTEKGGGGECRPGQQLVLARGGAKKSLKKKSAGLGSILTDLMNPLILLVYWSKSDGSIDQPLSKRFLIVSRNK